MCRRPTRRSFVRKDASRDTCNPTKRINGSSTSMRSSYVEHIGMRCAHSGKKNTNSTVLVLGGVGATNVSCGLRSGGETNPVAPYRARGFTKLAVLSFCGAIVSNSGTIECFNTRIIKSASSGYASTIQGNLDRIEIAGRKAPTESNAFKSPSF